MLIVNQNKKQIINLDNITSISILEPQEEGYKYALSPGNYDLGYYKTEARAKEILIEIAREFRRVLRTENRGTGQQRFYDVPKVYYMPEK